MLKAYNPPHIRKRDSNRSMMDDVLIVLIALYLMAFYYYGPRALLLGLHAAGVSIVCDLVCKLLLRQKLSLRDHSSLVTALLLPLLLPASVDYAVVAVAVAFALVVVKYPFGGVGHNLFNPAAGGFAFVAICFPKAVFSYPVPLEALNAFGSFTGRLVTSASYTLKAGGVPTGGDFLSMLLGNTPGRWARPTYWWSAPACSILSCAARCTGRCRCASLAPARFGPGCSRARPSRGARR